MKKIINLIFFISLNNIYSNISSLQNSPIKSIISMQEHLDSKKFKSEFYGKVYFVTLEDGTKAVLKDLSNSPDLDDAYAEVAAFKASQFLGFPNVPPTVIRYIDNKICTLQLYIEPTIDATIPGVYEEAFTNASQEDIANLKLFYFVFGQWDTGPHNIIIRQEEKIKLFAIDNSGICNKQYVRYGELPFVQIRKSKKLNTQDWDKSFPFDQVEIIEHPTMENLLKRFGSTIPKQVLENIANNPWPLYFVVYQNSLWRQFHKDDTSFIISHTNFYPEDSIAKLKSLNVKILKDIFDHAKDSKLLNEKFLNQILERRDQVIKIYEKTKNL